MRIITTAGGAVDAAGPYAKTTGFRAGECPHALTVWRADKRPGDPREHYVRGEVRCRIDHRLDIPGQPVQHADGARRWA